MGDFLEGAGIGCCAALVLLALSQNCSASKLEAKVANSELPKTLKGKMIRQIDVYQKYTAPELEEKYGHFCKFNPGCSEYAKQAIQKYGPYLGTIKAAVRLARCNPVSKGGYDPVK